MDINLLINDIDNRPELAAMVAVGDCVGLADFYNFRHDNISCIKTTISIQQLLKWAATGPYAKFKDYADNTGNNLQLRSICYVAIQILNSLTDIDSNDITLNTMIATLGQVGILSNDDITQFNNLKHISPASIAENLFGYGVSISVNDISEAIK